MCILQVFYFELVLNLQWPLQQTSMCSGQQCEWRAKVPACEAKCPWTHHCSYYPPLCLLCLQSSALRGPPRKVLERWGPQLTWTCNFRKEMRLQRVGKLQRREHECACDRNRVHIDEVIHMRTCVIHKVNILRKMESIMEFLQVFEELFKVSERVRIRSTLSSSVVDGTVCRRWTK